ncbi:MAG: 2-succinyl-5-enolpyruvyl-6-hydroxy-3-cyclohexene-1-carboxylic-acid synthase [Microthrixaceae bacterium]|nr:2-succinyl-5-enolpyruvyl-6-hydroxy-3-cyclohexene-1-carboxylic-acid synthase [Microthrixaceae bacterium]
MSTEPNDSPGGPQELISATYAATLVDEWVRHGVRQAVVCPGSRSTPMAVALADDRRLDVEMCHDERSAGFIALGIGKATGRPAIVLTTSATAAVELHPAVVEADHAAVPLLALTADRPPELRGVGAPQTIDQRDLYGGSVRWFVDPGPPEERHRAGWRHLAADSFAATLGIVPGPVHVNLAFREPLVGAAGAIEGPGEEHDRVGPQAWTLLDDQVARLVPLLEGRRGVVVAGSAAALNHTDAREIDELAAVLGWPIIADHLSGCRAGVRGRIESFDSILRVPELAEELRPETVIRIGGLPASRVLGQWLATSGAMQFAIDRYGRSPDPDGVVTERFHVDVASAALALRTALERRAHPGSDGWATRWAGIEASARVAIDGVIRSFSELSEPGAARAALAAVPTGGTLMVSSSMPIRDLEWYSPGRLDVAVLANRGANGIDGVVSTAVGVALSGVPVVALVGDIAFLHDSNALLGLARRGVDLAIVVIDNDGGGIFSFLPQAEALEPARFERLFGTPHGVNLGALVAAHGIGVTAVTTHAGLEAALVGWRDRRGVQVVLAASERSRNAALHRSINDSVAAALCSG